jgi:hypothetical protein
VSPLSAAAALLCACLSACGRSDGSAQQPPDPPTRRSPYGLAALGGLVTTDDGKPVRMAEIDPSSLAATNDGPTFGSCSATARQPCRVSWTTAGADKRASPAASWSSPRMRRDGTILIGRRLPCRTGGRYHARAAWPAWIRMAGSQSAGSSPVVIWRGCASDHRGSASPGDKLDNAALTRGRS